MHKIHEAARNRGSHFIKDFGGSGRHILGFGYNRGSHFRELIRNIAGHTFGLGSDCVEHNAKPFNHTFSHIGDVGMAHNRVIKAIKFVTQPIQLFTGPINNPAQAVNNHILDAAHHVGDSLDDLGAEHQFHKADKIRQDGFACINRTRPIAGHNRQRPGSEIGKRFQRQPDSFPQDHEKSTGRGLGKFPGTSKIALQKRSNAANHITDNPHHAFRGRLDSV